MVLNTTRDNLLAVVSVLPSASPLYYQGCEGRGQDVLFTTVSSAPGTAPVPWWALNKYLFGNYQFQSEPNVQNLHLHSDSENEDGKERSVMRKANK